MRTSLSESSSLSRSPPAPASPAPFPALSCTMNTSYYYPSTEDVLGECSTSMSSLSLGLDMGFGEEHYPESV